MKNERNNLICQPGDRIKSWNNKKSCFMMSEVTSIRNRNGKMEYYVIFENMDLCFGEWVTEDQLDSKSVVKLKKSSSSIINDEMRVQLELEEYLGRTRNIEYLYLGEYRIKAWYFSPVPEPYCNNECLYCCEYCMRFFISFEDLHSHISRCTTLHPPGNEIYRKGNISVYEVDGSMSQRWCSNLCLITKLFLHHKTEYYDPTPFMFYVLCMNDLRGARPIGYFSKETDIECFNNLSCILAFPPYHRSGVGRCLIQFSYELSKIEKRPGGPERPLSDLGQLAYLSFWKSAIIHCLIVHQGQQISIQQISQFTGMIESDIKETIQKEKILQQTDRDWVWRLTPKKIAEWKSKESQKRLRIDPKLIQWIPPNRLKKKSV